VVLIDDSTSLDGSAIIDGAAITNQKTKYVKCKMAVKLRIKTVLITSTLNQFAILVFLSEPSFFSQMNPF